MIVDVILAAGLGTRAGGTKALLDLGGKPLLTRVLDEALASEISSVIVVTGSDAERVAALTRRDRVLAVHNAAFRGAQILSLQAGLAALPATTRAFLIHPVDHCLVNRHHVSALVRAFEGSGHAQTILRPRHQGLFGHPVLYAAAYARDFLALGPDESGRDVYRRHLERVTAVEVLDDDCLFDLDTPEDLAVARARLAPR